MKIVVTNDDGPHTPYLQPLVEALTSAGHAVVVVVPERPRSAAGLARTYHKPLRVRRLGNYYVVNGYPADAVFLALRLVAPDADLVLSGVNVGENIGVEATYGSGTVGAAIQGGVLGARSIAISMEAGGDLGLMTKVAVEAVEASSHIPRGVLAVSLNIPGEWSGGVYCARRLARAVYRERLYEGVDPRGERFYWRWGPRAEVFEPETDAYFFYGERGVTIVGVTETGLVQLDAFGRKLGAGLGAKHIYC
ncbi:5'/3'-nucleotidase SurE [Pyrobaculum neutrophilum]|uniref:5'-nucleotidase SurE n=1 Tax=Pyrobaculum neutrophilum (strain DSM 2338 / JCM 9278 / NBRC 100436 / V24Sta) TaxID=444157 RepID=B1YDF5_PYRNV|nr:5'/3'-nucleotidase SurE [Pyrobaculum neutrophilum]ACB39818.1 stationary-phase survival protein SurE [Pyrobaculum neutrophilum V24Sta]